MVSHAVALLFNQLDERRVWLHNLDRPETLTNTMKGIYYEKLAAIFLTEEIPGSLLLGLVLDPQCLWLLLFHINHSLIN